MNEILKFISIAVKANAKRAVFAQYRHEITEEATSYFCMEIWKAIQSGRYDPTNSPLENFCHKVVNKQFRSFCKRYMLRRRKGGVIIKRRGETFGFRAISGVEFTESMSSSLEYSRQSGDWGTNGVEYNLERKLRAVLRWHKIKRVHQDAFFGVYKHGLTYNEACKDYQIGWKELRCSLIKIRGICRKYIEGRIRRGN